MTQPLRIEDPYRHSLITTRTMNEKLWFVNNGPLEEQILAKNAQYRQEYEVELFGLVIMGNHIHHLARFPEANRAEFMKCANSATAKAVAYHVPEFDGGKLWGRRYSEEEVPLPEDIEERFFYLALQPIAAGLCERISDYPGYNSFHDAIAGISRKHKVVDVSAFHNAKRFNPRVHIKDYTRIFELKYARLPGYDHLSQREYQKVMLNKYETRRRAIVEKRIAKGLAFLGRDALTQTKPTDRPRSPKKSTRLSQRPLVLTACIETRRACLERYFAILRRYREASASYLSGDEHVRFPAGTYKPPRFLVPLI